MPIPYRILNGISHGGVALLADGLVVSKEACFECFFVRGLDLLAVDSEDVEGMVVYYSVDDHRLYLGAGSDAKCGDLGLGELMDIRVVPMLLVSLVVIDVGLILSVRWGFASAIF